MGRQFDILGEFPDMFRKGGFAEDEAGVSQHAHQDVVEVVGDSACEPGQAFEPLCMLDFLFQPQPLPFGLSGGGDVPDSSHGLQYSPVFVDHWLDFQNQGPRLVVADPDVVLKRGGLDPLLQGLSGGLADGFGVLFADRLGEYHVETAVRRILFHVQDFEDLFGEGRLSGLGIHAPAPDLGDGLGLGQVSFASAKVPLGAYPLMNLGEQVPMFDLLLVYGVGQVRDVLHGEKGAVFGFVSRRIRHGGGVLYPETSVGKVRGNQVRVQL